MYFIVNQINYYYFFRNQKAESALKYYKGFESKNQQEHNAFYDEFGRLKSIAMKQKPGEKFGWKDFCKFQTNFKLNYKRIGLHSH